MVGFLGTLAPARVGVSERHHEPQCVHGGIESPRAPRVVIIVCFQNGFEQRLVVHRILELARDTLFKMCYQLEINLDRYRIV